MEVDPENLLISAGVASRQLPECVDAARCIVRVHFREALLEEQIHLVWCGLIAPSEVPRPRSVRYRTGRRVHRLAIAKVTAKLTTQPVEDTTSGLMIIARNQNSYKNLSEQISERLVKRTYQAFAVGNIPRSGKIEEPVGRHPRNRQKQAVTEKGKYALTRYSVLKKYGNYTHLEVNLETGRTHQIRVHMSHIGFPLIGDALYGRKKRFAKSTNSDLREVIEKFPRQALHASNLTFKDVDSENEVNFESSLPKDLLDLEKNLENLT